MRNVLLAAAILLTATGLALTGCEPAMGRAESLEPPLTLTVLTPHDQSITNAFSHSFARWYQQKSGKRVGVRPIKLGTLECLKYLDGLQNRASVGRREVPDVMFGGGIKDHEYLRERGYSRQIDVSADVAQIPEKIAGLPTRDPNGHWYGTGLSSFGIYFNAEACKARGIAPPQTWADLADARFAGWIGLADPLKSGSTREALQIVLQRYPEDGWSLLTRIAANARAVSRGSADVLDDVEDGVFLAGMAVNFEALRRANRSGGRTAYVNPAGASAVSPDVISVLSAAADPALATAFVQYVLSPEGQMLWAGDTSVNPISDEPLYHYPIRPSIYDDASLVAKLVMKENPAQTEFGVTYDLARADQNANTLLPLLAGLLETQHVRLQQAWRAHIAGGTAAEARWPEFIAPSFDAARMVELAEQYRKADAIDRDALRKDWAATFAQRLQERAGAGERG